MEAPGIMALAESETVPAIWALCPQAGGVINPRANNKKEMEIRLDRK
jgi:hypothetical protein